MNCAQCGLEYRVRVSGGNALCDNCLLGLHPLSAPIATASTASGAPLSDVSTASSLQPDIKFVPPHVYPQPSPADSSSSPAITLEEIEEIEKLYRHASTQIGVSIRTLPRLCTELKRLITEAGVVPAPPQILHCGCGAACTSEEYALHVKAGHESVLASPSAVADVQDARRVAIALGYIKNAANRRLSDLPCKVENMTERELEIFAVLSEATGSLQFIARELDSVDTARAQSKPDAEMFLHCSCGAACTVDEYAEHVNRGHDQGAPAKAKPDAAQPSQEAAEKMARELVDAWDTNNGICLLGDHRDDLIHRIATKAFSLRFLFNKVFHERDWLVEQLEKADSALITARSEALQDAMKAVCRGCQAEIEFTVDGLHVGAERFAGRMQCQALKIRALAQEREKQ